MQLEKLAKTEERFVELETLLADQSIASNQKQYQKLAKEYSDITPIVTKFRELNSVEGQIQQTRKLLSEKPDRDFQELAECELEDLQNKKEELLSALDELVNPKKKEKDRDLIMEVRAGTGGQEASIFAGDLYRMYCKYCDHKGWTVESISNNPSESGGYKEIIFSISGVGAEKHLQFESGAHRVQRVPATETSGRIHTSAATVAVLFEPEEIDVTIDPKDLKIDVFRASGPGGQSVNTTDSAIRITHLPSGLVVICQDERSQLKNKMKAMRVLRARLYDFRMQQNLEKETKERKLKVGSGDRSEKIRTYNYPDRRVTDHRIGFTSHKLQFIMEGEMDELTEALIQADREEKMDEA